MYIYGRTPYIFIVLCSLAVGLATAAASDAFGQTLPRIASISWLEDRDKTYTIEGASGRDFARKYIPCRSHIVNIGFTKSAIWLRIALDAGGGEAERAVLEFGLPVLDHVTVYNEDSEGIFRATRMGDALPFEARPLPYRKFVWPIPFFETQTTLYVRLESEGTIQFPVSVHSDREYQKKERMAEYGLGIYYGVILAMLAYNFFIFLTVRERSYIFYVLYLGFFGVAQACLNGFAAEYLWPSRPHVANMALVLCLGFSLYWGTWFTRSFLQTKTYAPALDSALAVISYMALAQVAISVFGPYSAALKAGIAIGLVEVFVIIVSGILSYRSGYRPAIFLLLAFSALAPGAVLIMLRTLSLVEISFLSEYLLQAGTAIDAILLSFGLADRIKRLEEEKDLARRLALETQKNFSRGLMLSQESERHRIATDLHDGIGQNLLVIREWMLRRIRPDSPEAGETRAIADLASQSIDEVREICSALRPHMLDRLGLEKAIEAAVKRRFRALSVECDISVDHVDGMFPKDEEIHIYRIVQEGVGNIAKHSGATWARVSMVVSGDFLEIVIKDNGKGMRRPEGRKEHEVGFGITGMTERVKMLKGDLEIISSPGYGTEIRIKAPVGNAGR